MVRILIAVADEGTRVSLRALFEPRGHEITSFQDGPRALRHLQEEEIDLMLADLELPGLDGLELLSRIRTTRPALGVILLAAFGSVEDAVRAMQGGAADFLSKPFTDEQVQLAVYRALEKKKLLEENRDLREALDDRVRLDNLIATDLKMQHIFKTVKAVASARTTVLITGESGTGKTLLARSLHNLSTRRSGPFIEVNCGALPESLLESELFGHVKGAFTGAVKDRPGKFEAADGGTIFLDEVATSSPSFQVKLLRVLQDRVVERVGHTGPIPVDVRVILAANVDLEEAVRQGTFREDLYYRINVVTVEMPPLRDRTADIPYLAEHFLRRFAVELGKPMHGFSPEVSRTLVRASWPGNVRQLENVVERAVVLTESDEIQMEDLPPGFADTAEEVASLLPGDAHLMPLKKALEIPEKILLERALSHHGGNRQATAQALGINRSTLFNKMRKFGL